MMIMVIMMTVLVVILKVSPAKLLLVIQHCVHH
jgi:hypothetical protein